MPANAKKSKRPSGVDSQVESHPPIHARIAYLLGEQGRRESLRRGGDGRFRQELTAVVADADLDAFPVDENGAAALDLAEFCTFSSSEFEFEAPAGKAH